MKARVSPALIAVCLASLAVVSGGCAPKKVSHPVQLRVEHEEPELIRVVHVVKPGQTLYRIALAYGMTADELMAANGISDPRLLSVGQELVIPGASELVEVAVPEATAPPVAAGAGPPKKKGPTAAPSGIKPPQPGRTTPASARATQTDPEEKVGPPDPRKGTLQWPLRGVLYGRFGKKGKEPHDGVDLAAPSGTPVKTAGEGQVLYAGEQRGYGLIVIVEHRQDLVTLYAHNKDLRVKTGQKVRPGQVIATVGESGRTSGPHLHFEVRKDGVPVDPMVYLGPIPPK